MTAAPVPQGTAHPPPALPAEPTPAYLLQAASTAAQPESKVFQAPPREKLNHRALADQYAADSVGKHKDCPVNRDVARRLARLHAGLAKYQR